MSLRDVLGGGEGWSGGEGLSISETILTVQRLNLHDGHNESSSTEPLLLQPIHLSKIAVIIKSV